jgi:hypothetical protein
MGQPVAVGAGAATAALGALIVGEYPFRGWMPFVAGVLFGLVVAEVMVTVAMGATAVLGVAAAALAAAGLAYAARIDSGYGLHRIGAQAWAGVVIAAVVAGARAGRRTRTGSGQRAGVRRRR